MPSVFSTEEQTKINHLRITLAQLVIEAAGIRVADDYSRQSQTSVLENLRALGASLDQLGLKHAYVNPLHVRNCGQKG